MGHCTTVEEFDGLAEKNWIFNTFISEIYDPFFLLAYSKIRWME